MMVLLICAGLAYAQTDQPQPAGQDTLQAGQDTSRVSQDTTQAYRGPDESVVKPTPRRPPARLSGELGFYGELYSVDGREKRRPSSTARVFLRPTLTLLGTFRTSLDIIYSTEGSSARQSINQFALHPRWSWGQLHLGDFSHKFSEYTLNNITIRGAGIEINPGLLRFQAVGGQSKRKVKSGPAESVYSQYAYGFKLGVGKEDGSFFDVNVLKVKDDKNSLPVDIFEVDSLNTDSTSTEAGPQNGVTPEENLVLGVNSLFRLFNRRLTFRGEFAGSAFTRNQYSSTDASSDVPSALTDIFTPRVSSSFDYAYAAEAAFSQRIFNAKAGYTYVGPGYNSLGSGTNINDKQAIDAALGVRLLRGRLGIQTTFRTQNDNVADQKSSTTTRNTYGVTTTVRPVNQLSFVFNAMMNTMKNGGGADSTWIYRDTVFTEFDSTWTETDSILYLGEINNINSSYNANILYQFLIANLSQNVNFNYSMQVSKDKNPMRTGNDVNTQNIMISYMTMLNRIWTASISLNENLIDIQNQEETTQTGIGLQISNRVFQGKLSNTLGFNYTSSDESGIAGIIFQSGYSISRNDAIRLGVKSSFFNSKEATTEDYTEVLANLSYSHRF